MRIHSTLNLFHRIMTRIQFAETAIRNQSTLSPCISHNNDPTPVKAQNEKPSFISKNYVPTSIKVLNDLTPITAYNEEPFHTPTSHSIQ